MLDSQQEVSVLYKNWKGISGLANVRFKLTIAFLDEKEDQEFLRKIAMGFPELFTGRKLAHTAPFALSQLKAFAHQWCLNDVANQRSALSEGFQTIGFPSVLCAHAGSAAFSSSRSLVMPIELADDDHYRELSEAYQEGACFPFALITFRVAGYLFYLGRVNPDGAGDDLGKDVDLYPADLVNVNS